MWRRCRSPRDFNRSEAQMDSFLDEKHARNGVKVVPYPFAELLDLLYADPPLGKATTANSGRPTRRVSYYRAV